MKTLESFIVHPKTKEQVEAIKAFMNALKIKFEISRDEPYKETFVNEVLESKKRADNGEVTSLKTSELWK